MALPSKLTDESSICFLQQVFDTHQTGLAWLNEDSQFVHVNSAFLSIFRSDVNTIQQLKWTDVSLTIDESDFGTIISKQLLHKDTPPYFIHDRWILQDDSLLDVHVKISAVWNEEGEINGFLLNVSNPREEDRSEMILASVSHMFAHSHPDDLFQDIAQSLANMLGIPYVMISELSIQQGAANTLSVFANGHLMPAMEYSIKCSPCEIVVERSEPQVFPQQVQRLFPQSAMCAQWDIHSYVGVPFVDSNNQVMGFLAAMDSKIMEDTDLIYQALQIYSTRISVELERRRKEKELKESEEKFRRIFEASPLGIVLSPASEDFRSNHTSEFNPGFCQMLGYTSTELKEVGTLDITHPEDRENTEFFGQQLHEEPQASFTLEKRYIKKDSSILWAQVSISHVQLRGETWRIALIRDITSEKEKEHRLQIQAEELDIKNQELKQYIESNLALENFAYIASHDLKEPLRTIGNFSQLLQQRYQEVLDESGLEFVQFISEGAKSMYRLIDDLLLFSRINTKDFEIEEIHISHLVQEIIDSLHQLIQDKEAEIIFENLPPSLMGNPTKIRQLFQNLIANGIKFHKPNQAPRVSILCKSSDTHHTFAVNDQGIGIKEEYFHKIFLIFKKLHDAKSYEGTGIGLAICKRIVEQHNGRIWIESEEGVGTTFFFSLPIHQTCLK